MPKLVHLILATVIIHLLRGAESRSVPRYLRSLQRDDGTIMCKIRVVAAMLDFENEESSTNHEVLCVEPNGARGEAYVYVIEGSDSVLVEYANEQVSLTHVIVDDQLMTVKVGENVTITRHSRHRNLQELPYAIGTRTVLALRVSFLDTEPSYSAEFLGQTLFGADNGTITMQSQFEACSFGKLQLTPAQDEVHSNGEYTIANGVAEITVPRNTTEVGLTRWYAERAARAEAERLFGDLELAYDHVLFCMPNGIPYTDDRSFWVAYAYLSAGLSFYNDNNCLYVSVVSHELGHNFGLGHSNYGGQYGDRSGTMGLGYPQIGGPRRCFNAEKNYLLGWYSDRAVAINVLEQQRAWGGTLVAFPDYNKADVDEVVVIRIDGALDGRNNPNPHYIHFNRAKGFHSETKSFANLIVTVQGFSGYRVGAVGSYVVPADGVGGIAIDTAEQRYIPEPAIQQRIFNFANSNFDLIIEVCSQEYGDKDSADISIHIDDGRQQSACPQDGQPPSTAPSLFPSVSPSSRPTTYCEDSQDAWFDVVGYGNVNCLWLSHNRPVQNQICREGHPAYSICPDTCRKCHDNCEDDYQANFFVNRIRGTQNCRWLSVRPAWQTLLCDADADHPARGACGETCNSCPHLEISPNHLCEDDVNTTFYANHVQGWKNCAWLAGTSNPVWRYHLCRQEAPKRICAETCGACRDNCDDSAETFHVDRLSASRDCSWLAARPGWHAELCSDVVVADLCKETCNTC
ncbi:expressed unknown protein [Seminavis robusta]|uniref:Peptidase M11 gametolysin domain-containing protein n=1 Tax=Seminavis robusta TaxID=568900 RepID=A0A9N8DIG3_9STRA|nr:expressed unknown protein [Seminavis robusta]|eukprot:Sro169_g075270.1 n/a (743) ;mRNA; f:94379-96607